MSISQHNVKVFFWATLFGSVDFLEPVLTLFYLQRGLSNTDVVLALASFSAAVLISEVPTGAFADRYGPKASFLAGCLVRVASIVMLIFANAPWLVFMSRALAGVAATFFSGADEALIYESLKEDGAEEQMSGVLGKVNSAAFAAGLVAQVTGAFVVMKLGEKQFVLLLSVSAVLTLVQMFLLSRVRNPQSFEKFRGNALTHIKEGMAVIRRTPDLIFLFLNFTLVFIPTYVFTTFDQPYLTDVGLPVAMLGIMYGIGSVAQLILSRNVDWFTGRASRVTLMHLTGVTLLLTLLIAGVFPNGLPVAVIAFFLLRFSRTIRWPIYSHMQNEYIPSGSRATTLSLLSVFDSIFDLLIVLPLAVITAPFGRGMIFLSCAAFMFVGLLFPVKKAGSLLQTETPVTE